MAGGLVAEEQSSFTDATLHMHVYMQHVSCTLYQTNWSMLHFGGGVITMPVP
ncbi:hypothetical protein DL89DRAFT_266892 [Linderina pennispora]|uniref:Uncharacterized protein n=1 Tax=Linderina pennispora TaxID=61395 RepID=A0A1Y1WBK0_9FUNG|nr:uncharacterized protein DL89DRAFT_266892 [Linderina pennispora]ORX70745.1 hypothetical protein DL89DRAFT_266892 [Linderina pennispora]